MFFNSAASLSNLSGTTSTQVDTPTQSCSEENREPQNFQEPEENDQAESSACDGEVEPSQVRFDRTKFTLHQLMIVIIHPQSKFNSNKLVIRGNQHNSLLKVFVPWLV